jgi:hypothetical protein
MLFGVSVSLLHVPTAHLPPVSTYSLAPLQSSHSASSIMSQTVEKAHVSFVLFSKYVVEVSDRKYLSIWVAKAAIQSLHSPINSMDAERYFSIYNIVITDRRQRLKEENIETTTMLVFNLFLFSHYCSSLITVGSENNDLYYFFLCK